MTYFCNLTDLNIPESVIDIVSLGPNSSISCLYIHSDCKNAIRDKMVNNVQTFINKEKKITNEDREFAKK